MGYLMFVRHGPKLYKNNKGPEGMPRHDPPLDNICDREIVKKFLENFNRYGYPEVIYCSPFLRTRQTLAIIKKALPPEVKIFYDKKVEEYLGFQKPVGSRADLDKITYNYTDPKLGVENFQGLKKRAINFYDSIKDSEKNILIITHGIFISNIALNLNLKLNQIKELEGIVIEKDLINKV